MKIALALLLVGTLMCACESVALTYGDAHFTNVSQNDNRAARGKGQALLKVTSRQQAVQLVKQKFDAKILSVQSAKVDGKAGYSAKLLGNNGVVFFVFVDANSGQIKRR